MDGWVLSSGLVGQQTFAPISCRKAKITSDSRVNRIKNASILLICTFALASATDSFRAHAASPLPITQPDFSISLESEPSTANTKGFATELEWSWISSTFEPDSLNVMMTPSVIDLDGDGFPEKQSCIN